MTVELSDQAEDLKSGAAMPLAVTGEWKPYGNRYFTAKATVTVAGYDVMLGLENHYILSSNGIDEDYGKASYDKNGVVCLISPGEEIIEDGVTLLESKANERVYLMEVMLGKEKVVSKIVTETFLNGDIKLNCTEEGKTDEILLKKNGEIYANNSKVLIIDDTRHCSFEDEAYKEISPNGEHYNTWVENCPMDGILYASYDFDTKQDLYEWKIIFRNEDGD